MKTFTTVIAASLLAATFSASAFAATDRTTLATDFSASKAAAYEMGVNKLSALTASSSRQLGYEFGLANIEEDSVEVKNGFVTVEERADANGKVGYVGLVSVDVEFDFYDSDH